ncbi:MAG: glutathione S-transferase [Bermanella sp.]|jgi:glutathione S-transferase
MRARLAIFRSKQAVELRDVKLTNKPAAMLVASAKGTVPILVVSPKQVIDESLDVMLWTLGKSDPANLLLQSASKLPDLLAFIAVYDLEFKPCIERYKAAKRYHETNVEACRKACEAYIQDLEQRLSEHDYIFGEHESIADIAIFPFIRQFAKVERQWYVQSSYPNLKRWLNRYLQSGMFNKVMTLYPIWEEGNEAVVFCGD